MKKNLLKEKLRRGEPVSGCIIQGCFPALVEICGLAGFDFVFLDAEHGPLSPKDCEDMVRAAEAKGIVPLVRVPNPEPDTVLRFMDTGVMGIIVPGIATPEEAANAVRAVKYTPQGHRGLAGVRACDYGMRSLAEYVVEANRETMVLAIIENTAALANLADILKVDGLDGVILGAVDLSQSLGVPGQGQHAKVKAAYQEYVKTGLKSGKPFGTVVRPGETTKEYVDAGLSILLSSAFSLFGGAAKNFVNEFKQR